MRLFLSKPFGTYASGSERLVNRSRALQSVAVEEISEGDPSRDGETINAASQKFAQAVDLANASI